MIRRWGRCRNCCPG